MSMILGRRRLAVALATGAATLSIAGLALADTTTPAPTPTTGHGTAGHHLGGGLLSAGLFKTVFGIFSAVHDQTPAIAAPIISQAVTAGTITQAQADQLTALFAAKLPFSPASPASTRADTGTPSTGSPTPGHHGFTPLAPEQLKVLFQVTQAVSAQLPAIAKPVVDAAVTAGDITQSQADLITKVIGLFSSFKPGNFGITAGGTPGSAAPVGSLQTTVTNAVVREATKHKKAKKHSKKKTTKHSTRAKHSARAKH